MTSTVKDIYNEINGFAPFETGAEWDNPGLLIGDANAAVTKAVVALDVTDEELAQAHRLGAQLVAFFAHRPFLRLCIRHRSSVYLVIGLIVYHTNSA